MAFYSSFVMSLLFMVLTLVSPGHAQATTCTGDLQKAGSDMSQTMCGNGGGANANGTGTAFVPKQAAKKLKRQNGQVQNVSSLIEQFPYQLSPYYKPAAVLRACTGSIVTTYDTEDANLNGRGQTVVSQRQSCGSTGPIELFSGLGRSVRVIEEDLHYGGWIVHITDDYFTIPTLLSSTLQTVGGTGLFANTTAPGINAFDFVPSITAFIPSDSAFATALRCSQGSTATINALALLSANIIPGTVLYSPLLVDGAFFRSASGDDITVTITNGTKYVNGAPIVQEDIVIQNGVVHIVGGLVSDTGLHCPTPPQTTSTSISPITATLTTTITTTRTEILSDSICRSVSSGPVSTRTLVSTSIVSVPVPPVTTVLTVTTPSTTILTVTNTNLTTSVFTVTTPSTTVLTVTIPTTISVTVKTPTFTTVGSFSTLLTTSLTTTTLTPIPSSPSSPSIPSSSSTPCTSSSTHQTTPTTTWSTLMSTQPPQYSHQSTYPIPESVSPTTPCPESEVPTNGHGSGWGSMSKGTYQSRGPVHY